MNLTERAAQKFEELNIQYDELNEKEEFLLLSLTQSFRMDRVIRILLDLFMTIFLGLSTLGKRERSEAIMCFYDEMAAAGIKALEKADSLIEEGGTQCGETQ